MWSRYSTHIKFTFIHPQQARHRNTTAQGKLMANMDRRDGVEHFIKLNVIEKRVTNFSIHKLPLAMP